jgi:hypothetical protein
MFTTMASLVGSVAVTSINTFFVFRVILLCSELMIGGIDSTRSSESYMIGYTGESRMMGRYLARCFSDCYVYVY